MKVISENELIEEIGRTKYYKDNIEDEVTPGNPKKYMNLNSKKAEAFCRARGNCLDPAQRNPYHPVTIWKSKFCEKRDQSTKHYVEECKGLGDILTLPIPGFFGVPQPGGVGVDSAPPL